MLDDLFWFCWLLIKEDEDDGDDNEEDKEDQRLNLHTHDGQLLTVHLVYGDVGTSEIVRLQ